MLFSRAKIKIKLDQNNELLQTHVHDKKSGDRLATTGGGYDYSIVAHSGGWFKRNKCKQTNDNRKTKKQKSGRGLKVEVLAYLSQVK